MYFQKILLVFFLCYSQGPFHNGIQTFLQLMLQYFLFFSSPEQEVCRVSYCDWYVVRLSIRPSVHNYKKKKSSSSKLTIGFQSNFTEMILRPCYFKILQRIEFHEELWLPWQQSEKTLKIFLSQTVSTKTFIFGM